jgi:hypothetical protein
LEVVTLVFAWHRQLTDEKLAQRYMFLARILYPTYMLLGSLLFFWIYGVA